MFSYKNIFAKINIIFLSTTYLCGNKLHTMASNSSNNVYDVITDKRIIPYASLITGTIVTNGTGVTGTGTLFNTEMKTGSYLVDLAHNEYRQIRRLGADGGGSDTIGILDKPFSNVVTGQPLVIDVLNASPVEISVIIPILDAMGSSNASGLIVDNYTATTKYFPAGLPYTISKANRDRSALTDSINPIIVDASGTQMIVTIIKR